MDKKYQEILLEINRQFYDQFAPSFSRTRHQAQPGVKKIAQRIDKAASVLDIGCGNGTLACALAARGFTGEYLGLDLSPGLLSEAVNLLDKPSQGVFNFMAIDLAQPGWEESIPQKPYDWLVSFAVLHHLPGDALRRQTVKAFSALVANHGRVAVSVWQWQNSPRLRQRVLPWSTVGVEPEDLDPGDVLLDWRAGEEPGLRYVHTFDAAELTGLAEQGGFKVLETFYSDGKSGDLALYQVWMPEMNP